MRVLQDGGLVGSLSVGWIPTFCELLQAVAMPEFPLRLHSRGNLPFVTAHSELTLVPWVQLYRCTATESVLS